MSTEKPQRPEVVDFEAINRVEYPTQNSARALGFPPEDGPFETSQGARWDKDLWVPTLTLGWPPISEHLPQGLTPSSPDRRLFGVTVSLPEYSLRVPKMLWRTLDHPTLREVGHSHVEFTPREGGPTFIGRNVDGKQEPIDWSPIADGWRDRDRIQASLWLGYAAALTVAQDRAFDVHSDVHCAIMEAEATDAFEESRSIHIDGLAATMWIEHRSLPEVGTNPAFDVGFPDMTFHVGLDQQDFEVWTDAGHVGDLVLTCKLDEASGALHERWQVTTSLPDDIREDAAAEGSKLYARRLISDGVGEYADQVSLHFAAGLPAPGEYRDKVHLSRYSVAHMDRPERFAG